MDIQHHFIEAGQGFPLLLLHGNGEDCSYFSHQLAELSPSRRVIAIDTRGHGKTPRGQGAFTLDRFAEDLLGFLDEHGIAQTDLLGFSDGGNIALIFALRYPERVRKLILNGANLNPDGVLPRFRCWIRREYLVTLRRAAADPAAAEKAELLALMVQEPNIAPEELHALQIPTLVLAGTHDLIPEAHTRLIAEHIPNARLRFLPGGHCIARENPRRFNRIVIRFLTEN